jgi:hypothetical protein
MAEVASVAPSRCQLGHGELTGIADARYIRLVRFSFLILIDRFVTLEPCPFFRFP